MWTPSCSGGVARSDEQSKEEAAELDNYLPLSFKIPKEQEYIEFLWDAFVVKGDGGIKN